MVSLAGISAKDEKTTINSFGCTGAVYTLGTMSIKKVGSAEFKGWVQSLIKKHTVYGVQEKEDRFAFDVLEMPEDLRLDYDVTILPPKKYIQPQKEVLLTFDENGVFESVMNEESFLILGVHPYDMVAISQMDKVFTKDNRDEHYMAYRERATIIVSDVQTASKDVFAGCMGTSTGEECSGHDVLLTLLPNGSTLLDAKTQKGESLLDLIPNAAEPQGEDLEARTAIWESNRKELRKHELHVAPSDLPELLERSYDHPVWNEKSELCYACGSCNLVCPTCYCFNVQDDFNWDLKSGTRSRCWDSCMVSSFAKVAGDHDFRPLAAARYRHRYYRKGKYVPDMIGEIACVGCGRCITSCTAKIANPAEVYNRLLEKV